MAYDTYDSLVKHTFVKEVNKKGMKIIGELRKPNSPIIGADYNRDPSEDEFYCIEIGFYLTHLLAVVQQLEHTILYMSNFSPSGLMKNAGVNRSTHLIWSVENYIIRTQTVYDRLLVLTDRLFHIQNQPNQITHESIVTNKHISRTAIPKSLKQVRTAVKKYYHDRNTIIHEASYLDNELKRIEAYAIVLSNSDYYEIQDEYLKKQLKGSVKEFLKKRKREFIRINKNVCVALSNVFSQMLPIYAKKYAELCGK